MTRSAHQITKGLAYVGAERLEVAKQTVRAMHDATIMR